MDRRALIGGGVLAALGAGTPRAAGEPEVLLPVDGALASASPGVRRLLHPPERLPDPVLTDTGFGVTQPYLSVFRDREQGRFRIWFNRGPAVWHAVSRDGLAWEAPRPAWDLPRAYGASLIDDGERAKDPARRFKLANWQSTRELDDTPADNGGMFVGFSPDGLQWTGFPGNPVLRTYPTGWPRIEREGVGDTVDCFYDPVRGRYAAAVKVHALPEDGYAPAPKAGRIFRRLVGMTASPDFVRWERPWRIFAPDAADPALLEFYGMGGVHARGGLLLGFLRVLRDDLPCDPGGPADGIGYSVLAWSSDGRHWHRERAPFLDRNPTPGSWDHAMSWIGAVLAVDGDQHLYYGGYSRGHKVGRRQIGLARMRRDRYVALSAPEEGLVRSRPVAAPASVRLNARTLAAGSVRARLVDERGRPLKGCDWGDGPPFAGDALDATFRWRRPAAGRVSVELDLRRAEVFAVTLERGG